MHYRGFAFVSEATDEALNSVMAPHEEKYIPAADGDEDDGTVVGHWDWWRAGGRYDGYLVSDAEMDARSTDNGFNFQPENKRMDRNYCVARDVPPDRRKVYFFVADGDWVERESYVPGVGMVECPDYEAKLAAAFERHPDSFVVVVDAHS